MSVQLRKIANELPTGLDAGFDREPPQIRLMATREAVARLCWGSMFYKCDTCEFGWNIWMALGVEGPPNLSKAGLYVASPFMLGQCPAWPDMAVCEGKMVHRGRD